MVWTSGETTLIEDVPNWWEYFFTPLEGREDVTWSSIPPAVGVLTVTLKGSRPAIGSIIVGRPIFLGTTRHGVETGNLDYSRVEVDAFGNESWVKRRNARQGLFPIWFPLHSLDFVRKTLARVSGSPSFWIGHSGYESMIMIGYARDDSSMAEGPELCTATLDIRGIV